MENITEILKGVLEGLVLEIISRRKTYGYDITQQLKKLGFQDVVEGTVYTILVRLEKNGYVDSEKEPSEFGPPRKLYKLTLSGHKELESFWHKWNFVSSAVNGLRRK